MKEWTVDSARRIIERNGGHVSGGQIRISNPGLKILGAIDFLVNHHRYTWIR